MSWYITEYQSWLNNGLLIYNKQIYFNIFGSNIVSVSNHNNLPML